jgi:hypothetical protein
MKRLASDSVSSASGLRCGLSGAPIDGMTDRMKLRKGDLAHWLSSSINKHIDILKDATVRGRLRVDSDAVYEMAKLVAAEFEARNIEITVEVASPHSFP